MADPEPNDPGRDTAPGAVRNDADPQRLRRLTWQTFGVLMAAALVGIVGIIPYALALTPPPPGAPLPVLIVASVVQSLVLTAIATSLGLWLGTPLGLGAPQVVRWLGGDRTVLGEIRAATPLAVGLGVATSLAVVALDAAWFGPQLAQLLPEGASSHALNPPPLLGFFTSFYGGIVEELLLRLGVMTFFVWLGVKERRAALPSPAVVWSANILAAVLFGLGHLPATAALLPLTPLVVARAVLLNGLVGIAAGWLYWRRGLLLAMIAHFCADLVLHVIAPLFIK